MRVTNKINTKKWEEFIEKHPSSNIFQSPEMYKVYKNTQKYSPIFLAVIDKNDNIVATLLAVIQKEHTGLLGDFSARSIIFGGPLIKDNNLEILHFILKEYLKVAGKKVIYSQFRNMRAYTEQEKIIFKANGLNYEEHLNILIDLNRSSDALWKDLKKSRKEGIRKAKRNKLVFKISNPQNSLHSFYKLLKVTYAKIKLPYPEIDFFENLIRVLPSENIKFFTLKKEEKIIISLVALIYKNCLSAFYIGIDGKKKILNMRPVDLFYWEVIKWGNENNCTTFDWMGAGKPNVDYGVRKFKLQYGGNLAEYGRFEINHKPYLMYLAKTGLKLYKFIK